MPKLGPLHGFFLELILQETYHVLHSISYLGAWDPCLHPMDILASKKSVKPWIFTGGFNRVSFILCRMRERWGSRQAKQSSFPIFLFRLVSFTGSSFPALGLPKFVTHGRIWPCVCGGERSAAAAALWAFCRCYISIYKYITSIKIYKYSYVKKIYIYIYTAISKCQQQQDVKSKLWQPPPALPFILFAILYFYSQGRPTMQLPELGLKCAFPSLSSPWLHV